MLSLIAKTLLQGTLPRHGNTHFLSWEALTLGCVIWLCKKGAGFMTGLVRKIFLSIGRVNNSRGKLTSKAGKKAKGCFFGGWKKESAKNINRIN